MLESCGSACHSRPPRQLVILVHGLWGSRFDWAALEEQLRRVGDDQRPFIVHTSVCNEHHRTYEGRLRIHTPHRPVRLRLVRPGALSLHEMMTKVDRGRIPHLRDAGIDVCGHRLAQEVASVVAQHPEATHLSLLGHSMGGLIARYAAGELYDPTTGLIAGLAPGWVCAGCAAPPCLGTTACSRECVRHSVQ